MGISNVQAAKLVLFPSLLALLEQRATANGNKAVVDLTKQIKFSTSTLVAAVAFTVTTLALTLFTSASWILTLRVMAFIGFCFTTLAANKLLQAVQALKRVNTGSQQASNRFSGGQRQQVTESKLSASDITHQKIRIGSEQELRDLLYSGRDLGSISEMRLEVSSDEVLGDDQIVTLFGTTGETSFTSLRRLHLLNGKFSEEGLVFLQKLPRLEYLNLKGSIIQDTRRSLDDQDPFECIARIRGLKHFDLSSVDGGVPKITLDFSRKLQGALPKLGGF